MAIAATGFFDGVHVGHRLVIETLVSTARERGEESLVITFWPHPRFVIKDGDSMSLRLLNTMDEKLELLSGLGVDRVEVIPFTQEFSRLSAKAYLEKYVKEKYGCSAILLGYDNRLGGDGLSSVQTAAVAREVGLEVICTDKVSSVGIAVSSTKIRRAIVEGNMEQASAFLKYDYSLSGIVVHGNEIGRTLGFPTANMDVGENAKLMPGSGSYVTRVEVDGGTWYGMTNIGVRPTIDLENKLTVETNIFDFDKDIYDRDIKVSFIKRVRDEITFTSLDDLKRQLIVDREYCRNFLSAYLK